MALRIVRAVSCSLALHGLAWAALRDGPPRESQTAPAPVTLGAVWTEPEPARVVDPVRLVEPGWIPVPLEMLPEAEPPPVAPPQVALYADVPPEADIEAEEVVSPYWEGVRRELSRSLRWPSGWQTRTNIHVRIHAVPEGLLPLEPPPGMGDAVHSAVRRAVERAIQRTAAPPDDEVGRGMRLTVRFEPEH